MSEKFKQRFAGAAQVASKAKQAASAKAAKAKKAMKTTAGNLALDAKKTTAGQMLRHKTLSTGAGLGSDTEYSDAAEDFSRLKREVRSLVQNVEAYKKNFDAVANASNKIAVHAIHTHSRNHFLF
jgi:hypothetical protein